MEIVFTGVDKGGDHPIFHDLNFQEQRYEAKHVIVRTKLIATRFHSNMIVTDLQEPQAWPHEFAQGKRTCAGR